MKHTEGKWLSHKDDETCKITIYDSTYLSRHIAYMPMDSMPKQEQEANAALICRAPELEEENKRLRILLTNLLPHAVEHRDYLVLQTDSFEGNEKQMVIDQAYEATTAIEQAQQVLKQ